MPSARRSFTNSVRRPGGAPDRASSITISTATNNNAAPLPTDHAEFQQEFTRPTLPEPDDALQGKLNIATCKDRFVIGLPLYGSWEEVEVLIFPGFTSTARRRSNSDHAGNSNQGNVQKKDRTALYVRFPRELPMEAEDFEQALEALLELARDVLACSAVHIVIDTDAEEVPEIVHTLQYVGFLPVPLPTSVSGVVMLRYDLEA
jgi:hypothetical protein